MTAIEPTEAMINDLHDQVRRRSGRFVGTRDIAAVMLTLEQLGYTASAPQEPKMRDRSSYDNVDVGRERSIDDSPAQEPVADDDAEWLLRKFGRSLFPGDFQRLERIANRLQAKAPETDYCKQEGEG